MSRKPLHNLVRGPQPAPDRVFFHGHWASGHKNPRYARFVERLERLDAHLLEFSDRRVPAAIQFRAWHRLRGPRERAVFGLAGRRYRYMWTNDPVQVRHFPGLAVVDLDEPHFEQDVVDDVNRDNVVAVVTSNPRTAARLEEIGMRKPWIAMPAGVDLSRLRDDDIRSVAERHRRNGELVVGHISAWFHTKDDRHHNWTNDLDHILGLWDGVHANGSGARLWLIGNASASAKAAVDARDDVELFDSIPYGGALPYVANFDVALYPRSGPDYGIPVKLFEYMGVGAPIVSYDLGSTQIVRETGSGLMASDEREFSGAVTTLLGDDDKRRELGAAGREAAVDLDWDAVIDRYGRDVLDVYLPRD